MPLIQVKLIQGVFGPAEKQQIIKKLTDAMVSIEGETMRAVTWVTIEEVASGEWGMPATRCVPRTCGRCAVPPVVPGAPAKRSQRKVPEKRRLRSLQRETPIAAECPHWGPSPSRSPTSIPRGIAKRRPMLLTLLRLDATFAHLLIRRRQEP